VVTACEPAKGLGSNVAYFNIWKWRVVLQGTNGDDEEVGADGLVANLEVCLDEGMSCLDSETSAPPLRGLHVRQQR
jgi:hypothetical protein